MYNNRLTSVAICNWFGVHLVIDFRSVSMIALHNPNTYEDYTNPTNLNIAIIF